MDFPGFTRDIRVIEAQFRALADGKADVINGRSVLRDGPYFWVEGWKSKQAYNKAAARLARIRKPRWLPSNA
jgi:hypothetical protein